MEIEHVNLHFIHMPSESPNAIPLLLVHGWPGSFLEFRYILDALVKPTATGVQAFHVVVPSLPGHTYSETPRRRGWTMQDTARVFNRLMVGLGYTRYMCQGGDWGHQVCRYLGSLFTENCKCKWPFSSPFCPPRAKLMPWGIVVHLNMCPAPPPRAYFLLESRWVPEVIKNFLRPRLMTSVQYSLCKKGLEFGRSGLGYAQIQGTRPATIGYSLLDSPVGHLCWLGEKWIKWSDTESPSAYLFQDPKLLQSDDILANISLYWFTRSILSSFIPYLENRDGRFDDYRILNLTIVMREEYKISVPMGVSIFKYDLCGSSKSMVAKTGLLKFYRGRSNHTQTIAQEDLKLTGSEYSEGGHFAALDRPQELLTDVREFAQANRHQIGHSVLVGET